MAETSTPFSQKNHLDYIDVLNVLASFAVVMLHTNCFWDGPSIGRAWISANFIESFFYWAVPIFFMISGVTLMDYRQRMTTSEYFVHRVRKTLVPFVMWTLIGIADGCAMGKVSAVTPSLVASELIAPSIMKIYWFFPALFGIYLCIPVISAIQPRHRLFQYIICVGVVGQSALPLALNLIGLPTPEAFVPTIATGYIFYVILGYELGTHKLSRKQMALIYVLGVCGFVMQMVGTWVLSDAHTISLIFKGYLNLPAVLQAPAVFVAVKSLIQDRGVHVPALVSKLSGTTFGIYLIHLYLVRKIPMLFGIPTRSIVWRTGGALGIFLASACIVWLLQRIEPVKKYLLP